MANCDNNPVQQICRGAAGGLRPAAVTFKSTHSCNASGTLASWPNRGYVSGASTNSPVLFRAPGGFPVGDGAWRIGSANGRLSDQRDCRTCIGIRDSSPAFRIPEEIYSCSRKGDHFFNHAMVVSRGL